MTPVVLRDGGRRPGRPGCGIRGPMPPPAGPLVAVGLLARHFALFGALLTAFPASASTPQASCTLQQGPDEAVVSIPADPDALGGTWREFGYFRVRMLLAAPAGRAPWLQVEVHAEAADGDPRVISLQKAGPPFATGRMEVVEPGLGRSLRYECGAAR